MKKLTLALALVLLPASAHPSPATPPETYFHQASVRSEKWEARLEQQKSKWAPNGMKVLILHGKRCWVGKEGPPPVEKREIVPIPKEGV